MDMGTRETWAAYVRAWMTEFGDSQSAAGRRSGIPQGAFSQWLTGERGVSDGNAAKFAQAYGRNPLEAFVAGGLLSYKAATPGLDDDALALLRRLGFGDDESSSASIASA